MSEFGDFELTGGVGIGEICIDIIKDGESVAYGYASKSEAINLANAILEMANKKVTQSVIGKCSECGAALVNREQLDEDEDPVVCTGCGVTYPF